MSAELGRRVDGVSRDAMAMLMAYPFPGNMRELRNLLERAMVCAAGPILQVSDFGIAEVAAAGSPAPPASLEEVERRTSRRFWSSAAGT
jgi:two-component system, NtrC family, response regulator AtoC